MASISTIKQPSIYGNPLATNALEGVKAEFLSKIPLLLAAEAQRTGGIVVGDRLFNNRDEAYQYIQQVKAAGGPLASQIDLLTADFSQLGNEEGRIHEASRLGGIELTEGQKLAKQADTQRLIDLGGNADGGLAQGYNNLNLMLQSDSMKASAALDDQLNPEQARIRAAIGKQVGDDIGLGNTLSESQRRATEQNIRSGQAARGNILGTSSLLQEADGLMTEGDRQQNIRQGRGYAFLENGDRKGNLFGTSTIQGAALDESSVAGTQDTDFGGLNANSGEWGTSSLVNAPPPKKKKSNGWGSLLGTVAGAALGYFTGGIGMAAGAAIGSKLAGGGKQSDSTGQASGNFSYPNTTSF